MSSAPNLSPVVAGVWRLHEWGWTPQQRLAWVEGCVARGVTSFDHADLYGRYEVERLFGEALALAPGLREQLQLVSKCGIRLVCPQRPHHAIKSYDTSAAHITASVENSLRQLRSDRLDLLLIHRPDALLEADEVADAFGKLREAGKVLHFGVSNFTPSQLTLLQDRIPLVTNQVECSLLHLNPIHDGTFDQAQQLRQRPMLWSPLAGGRLFTEDSERAHRVRSALHEVAQRLGASTTEVALAWLMRLPCRPLPIIGSRRLEVIDAATSATQLRLEREDWWRVWIASSGQEPA